MEEGNEKMLSTFIQYITATPTTLLAGASGKGSSMVLFAKATAIILKKSTIVDIKYGNEALVPAILDNSHSLNHFRT